MGGGVCCASPPSVVMHALDVCSIAKEQRLRRGRRTDQKENQEKQEETQKGDIRSPKNSHLYVFSFAELQDVLSSWLVLSNWSFFKTNGLQDPLHNSMMVFGVP